MNFGGYSHRRQYLQSVDIQRSLFTHLFPRLPCHKSSDAVCSKSLTIQTKHYQLPINQCRSLSLVIFFSRHNRQQNILRQFCSLREFSFTIVLHSQSCWDLHDAVFALSGTSAWGGLTETQCIILHSCGHKEYPRRTQHGLKEKKR